MVGVEEDEEIVGIWEDEMVSFVDFTVDVVIVAGVFKVCRELVAVDRWSIFVLFVS